MTPPDPHDHDLRVTVARIRELDRLYLLADHLWREWMRLAPGASFDVFDQGYERWQRAQRRYRCLRDSQVGLPPEAPDGR